MKLSNTILFLLISFLSYANIDAGVDAVVYYEGEEAYLELNIHIIGESVSHEKTSNELMQASVNTEIVILNLAGDTILVDQYSILSPEQLEPRDFINLKRYVIEPGEYLLHINLVDKNDAENTFRYKDSFQVALDNRELLASKPRLLASLTKSNDIAHPLYKYGYILEPATFRFFHRDASQLYTYFELYNNTSSKDSLEISIDLLREGLNQDTVYSRSILKEYQTKSIVIEGFDLTTVYSGNYMLLIKAKTLSSDVWSMNDTLYFQRSNPVADVQMKMQNPHGVEGTFVESMLDEELVYAMKGLTARLSSQQRAVTTELLKDNNIEGMRYFIYNYWMSLNPITPYADFQKYMKVVKAVDKTFYSTYGHGFETDRGYVYLRYGKPNNVITVENEPSAPPYEIWFYDWVERTNQSNVKFLFYNPNLGAYHYELLHSTCRGEKQNEQWELELYSKAPNEVDGDHVDGTRMKSNFNRRARQYFEDQN